MTAFHTLSVNVNPYNPEARNLCNIREKYVCAAPEYVIKFPPRKFPYSALYIIPYIECASPSPRDVREQFNFSVLISKGGAPRYNIIAKLCKLSFNINYSRAERRYP